MYCNLNVQKQKTKTNKYELRISNRNEARGKQVILILLNESFLKRRRKQENLSQNNEIITFG